MNSFALSRGGDLAICSAPIRDSQTESRNHTVDVPGPTIRTQTVGFTIEKQQRVVTRGLDTTDPLGAVISPAPISLR